MIGATRSRVNLLHEQVSEARAHRVQRRPQDQQLPPQRRPARLIHSGWTAIRRSTTGSGQKACARRLRTECACFHKVYWLSRFPEPCAQLAFSPHKASPGGACHRLVLIATTPVGTDDDSVERLRLDADFDARWAAWQTRGRIHDRAVRGLLMLAPAVAIAAAIVYLLLIR
jgi:hypothetical protein